MIVFINPVIFVLVFVQSVKSNERKDNVAVAEEVDVCSVEERCSSGEPVRCPHSRKSIGNSENFYAAYMAVSRMLFDSCLQVMWNAVFYDSVAEYSSEWRKMKRWPSPSYVVEQFIPCKESSLQIEKLPADCVCVGVCHFSWFEFWCILF